MNLSQQWRYFVCAYQFLTRVPAPSGFVYSDDLMHESARYYPLVGGLIGVGAGLVFWLLSLVIPPVPALLLSTAFTLYLTGAFHEDGFADMCDGLGGGQSAERALEIMKDSRLGTYGVAGLSLMLALKLSLLVAVAADSMPLLLIVLILGHLLSRSSAVVVIMTSDYARLEGTAKPVSMGLSSAGQWIAILTSAAACMAATLVLGFSALFLGLLALTLAHWFARSLFEKRLGGYTGDCLGATQQMSEVGFYLGVVACL